MSLIPAIAIHQGRTGKINSGNFLYMRNLPGGVLEKYGVHVLSQDEADSVLFRVSSRHVSDASKVYWWSSIKTNYESLCYGDSVSGLSCVAASVGAMSGDWVYLVITDDDPYPWSVYEIKKADVIDFISDIPLCEYFVSDLNSDCVVFDTHDNEIYISIS
ncbi:hypothetical protein [Marilutibacter maris]|uniref:hypothetical protein n=1 Tax=Marilutibacter maris TaxID=1605891 RepID=UPI0011AEB889|nr:hypothetical protein [Lysobacter maris]